MSKLTLQKRILIVIGILFIFLITLARVSYVCACNVPYYERLEYGHTLNQYPKEETVVINVYAESAVTELPEVVEEEVIEPLYTDEEVEILTNVLYGEARGIKSKAQKAAVIWCILNRVDHGYGTIKEVVTAPHQFSGYKANRTYGELDCYYECREIVIDVLDRYFTEEQTGRVLPENYLYFIGRNGVNLFTAKWRGTDYWDWSLPNPYEN